MKTEKQKETNEKEVPLLEQKGYERMINEMFRYNKRKLTVNRLRKR